MDVIPVQAPNGLQEIVAHYGDPKIRVEPDGSWGVDPAWESANMIRFGHELIPPNRRGARELYMHRIVAPVWGRVLDRWATRIQAGDPYRVLTMSCFAPRAKRGGTNASVHSWGAAVDVNADTNRLIAPCAPDDPRRQTARDMPDAWIADARAEGFMWGGDFGGRFDPMHFQMATGY
jgi:hypothetical protein